jgi:WD repeat-containing protein 44
VSPFCPLGLGRVALLIAFLRKGVSFLSKLIPGGKKHKYGGGDGESADSDSRPEGRDAQVFKGPVGYIPQLPPLPKYIKVGARNG